MLVFLSASKQYNDRISFIRLLDYLDCCSEDKAKDVFLWDSDDDLAAMALELIVEDPATSLFAELSPFSTWEDMTFPSWNRADDTLDSSDKFSVWEERDFIAVDSVLDIRSVERDRRRCSWWYSTASCADNSVEDSLDWDETFLMLAVAELELMDVFAAMEDIEEDSWCWAAFMECCCIEEEEVALAALATSAAVLEERFVAATVLAVVADSMAEKDDFLTEEEATTEDWEASFCWCVKDARLVSSIVRGSTTASDEPLLKEPLLSKAEEYRSAEDFVAYADNALDSLWTDVLDCCL